MEAWTRRLKSSRLCGSRTWKLNTDNTKARHWIRLRISSIHFPFSKTTSSYPSFQLLGLQVRFQEISPPEFCMHRLLTHPNYTLTSQKYPRFHYRNNKRWPAKIMKFLVIEYPKMFAEDTSSVSGLNIFLNTVIKYTVICVLTPIWNILYESVFVRKTE
jgi:hypothetical protein